MKKSVSPRMGTKNHIFLHVTKDAVSQKTVEFELGYTK
jgi:hypothetical protein